MFTQNVALSPGTGNYTNHFLEIIVMLVVSFILGYLFRVFLIKRKSES